MTALVDDFQQLNITSGFVQLYTIDATTRGLGVWRFTPSNNKSIVFNGYQYDPMPIETEGWEMNADGTLPRPTLTVSNVNRTLQAAIDTAGDLVGAKVVRLLTLGKYLDGQPTADPTQYRKPYDVYYVYQRTALNKNLVSWQLATPLEAMQMKAPARQYTVDNGFPALGRYRVA